MTETVSVHEARNKLPDLLAQALAGNDIVITEGGMPVVRIIPVSPRSKGKRVGGLSPGAIVVSDVFDEPLPDEFWLGQA